MSNSERLQGSELASVRTFEITIDKKLSQIYIKYLFTYRYPKVNVKFIIIFGLFSFSYMYINSLHSNPLVFSILLTIPSDFDLLEVVSLNPLT